MDLENFERNAPTLKLNTGQLETICRNYFGIKGFLQHYQLLSGGAVNTTYKIIWDKQSYILRFYLRDPDLVLLEQSIFQLIHEQVPMPELFYVGKESNALSYSIWEYVPKKHINEISDLSLGRSLSHDLGKALAQIHSFCFPKAGLLSENFQIHTPFNEGSSPYYEHIKQLLSKSELVRARLGNRILKLEKFLETHRDFFPVIHKGGVLVHGDFKPVNLLWGDETGLMVLDWEFAHIGHPLFDFGTLLRHYKDFPLDLNSLKNGYCENEGTLPKDWVRKARLVDLTNIVDFLNSSEDRPRLFKSLLQSMDLTILEWERLEEKISS